ncbi:MAG TPA: hypothetical protein VK578_24090 [Edaphobacter sp.]|nr:hypothetical protein [Edaphobacter sp.]
MNLLFLRERILLLGIFLSATSVCVSQLPSAPTCDPSSIACNFPENTQSCHIRRCIGVDWNGCHGFWQEFNDPKCELDKAAKNKLSQSQKAACEVGKAAANTACQVVATASNATTQLASVADHVTAEATEVGMRILPGEIREGVVHLTKEAVNEIDKYPVLALYVRAQLGFQNPALGKVIDRIVRRSCSAPATLAALATSSHSSLTDFDKNSGLLTTPLKRLGYSGWDPTGCAGEGEGILTQDAAHSSDGIWTVDVSLLHFTIDGLQAPPNRFIRIELEPNLPANEYAGKAPLKKGERVLFGGPVVFDNDPPRFLEVHPINVFVRFAEVPPQIAASLTTAAPVWPRKYVVVRGDCLAWIAERNYGTQSWAQIYSTNRRLIKDPNLIYPGLEITLPAPQSQQKS